MTDAKSDRVGEQILDIASDFINFVSTREQHQPQFSFSSDRDAQITRHDAYAAETMATYRRQYAPKIAWIITTLKELGISTKSIESQYRNPTNSLGLRDLSHSLLELANSSSLKGARLHKIFYSMTQDIQPDLCFVLMPFKSSFEEIWQDAIIPAIAKVNLKCVRADQIFGPTHIMKDIWEHILRARVLVADMTEKNANVFYELGLAHAMEKDAILITQTMDDVPFDLHSLRVIRYGTTGRGLVGLSTDLEQHLRQVLKL